MIGEVPYESCSLCVVDPPYGVAFRSNSRERTPKFARIAGDTEIDGTWLPEVYRVLKDSGAVYVFTRWDVEPVWIDLIKTAGFSVKNSIVWDKGGGGMGDLEGTFSPQHERIILATKGEHKLRGKRLPDVIRMQKIDPAKLIHPSQKPVELAEVLVGASSDPGDIVIDLFCGSGPVVKACRRLNRSFYASEIEPKYAAIAQAGAEDTKSRMLF